MAIDFKLMAPSEYTSTFWQQRSGLTLEVEVRPHLFFSSERAKEIVRSDKKKCNVAFVGYPTIVKGWGDFIQIARLFSSNKNLEFFHFCDSPSGDHDAVFFKHVTTQMFSDGETSIADLLSTNEIDVVLVVGRIPETFSFVTFEALQAGSLVYAYQESGNVASVVRASKQGRLFDDFDALATGLLELSESIECRTSTAFTIASSESPFLNLESEL